MSGVLRRFVDLARALVLHDAFEDFAAADFDTLPGLTMVGPRRLEHLEALIMVRAPHCRCGISLRVPTDSSYAGT